MCVLKGYHFSENLSESILKNNIDIIMAFTIK